MDSLARLRGAVARAGRAPARLRLTTPALLALGFILLLAGLVVVSLTGDDVPTRPQQAGPQLPRLTEKIRAGGAQIVVRYPRGWRARRIEDGIRLRRGNDAALAITRATGPAGATLSALTREVRRRYNARVLARRPDAVVVGTSKVRAVLDTERVAGKTYVRSVVAAADAEPRVLSEAQAVLNGVRYGRAAR